ncbi:hypothetical protein GGU10DRAFT_361100 [Lentinula aff. detonsa]|uniref:Uncharacterized protein n=1 Tax=Lentinula aff. detonsa TaxID=2804958 RepID=A0AA38KYF7_9AGAR|nr:hypothetical protein GGU10DRAFT_361100 [Lentinula aff. detonsa]
MSTQHSHSSPSPNLEERTNRFAPVPSNQTTAKPISLEAPGNHFSARAASQPPRSSSSTSNTVLPSPTAAPRSPWSQSQSSTAKNPHDKYLSPTRTSGIPMPSQTRSSSFSGPALGVLSHSFSGLGTSASGGGTGYLSRFDSTFEDDESSLNDPQYGGEDEAGDEDDVDAMIGRIRPSVDPYDEYSDSPVYARKGVGITGGGIGRYGVGSGRLPPSLSSSLSPSQLPGKHQNLLYSSSPHSLDFRNCSTYVSFTSIVEYLQSRIANIERRRARSNLCI